MYDSVITGNENAYKDWNCIILMFLTSFIHCPFCFDYAYFMCIYMSKDYYLAFFGEDRLAILGCSKTR